MRSDDCAPSILDGSAASEEMQEQGNDGDNQQQVNQAAGHMERDPGEQPRTNQNKE